MLNSTEHETSESSEARKIIIFQHFSFYKELTFHAQFRWFQD